MSHGSSSSNCSSGSRRQLARYRHVRTCSLPKVELSKLECTPGTVAMSDSGIDLLTPPSRARGQILESDNVTVPGFQLDDIHRTFGYNQEKKRKISTANSDDLSTVDFNPDDNLGCSTFDEPELQKLIPEGGAEGVSSSASMSLSSNPPQTSTPTTIYTPIIYRYEGDAVPYLVRVDKKPVNLKLFKEKLPNKKGPFRFFFKSIYEDIGLVLEEKTEDTQLLPMYAGRVVAQINKEDDPLEI